MDEKENFLIIDDTQDRKYFTIVPNLVDEKYEALISGVYLHIKRKAGETGHYFETQLNACKKLKITSPTLRDIYEILEKDGFIKKIGTKVLKTKPVNVYRIVDVWLKNTEEIEKRYGKKNTTSILNKKDVEKPALLDVEKPALQGRTDSKEKPRDMSKTSFDFFCELKKLLEDKKRHIQIIGLWLKENKLTFDNYSQEQSFIRRYCKPAVLLEGYSNEDIAETIKVLKNTDYIKKFTLETVGKYIDQVKSQKRKDGPRIIRFEEIIKDGHTVMRPIYK